MMRILVLVLLLAQLEAAQSQFFHADVGTINERPAIGGGYRLHKGYNGCDLSAKVCPKISSSVQGLYLFYPMKGGLFLGAGPGYTTDRENMPERGAAIVNGVLGYQRSDKWFLQFENSTFIKQPDFLDRSFQSLSLGLAF